MPNRIIMESICESEKISGLTHIQFRLWIALITAADDNGRYDARPKIIKGRCFPVTDSVTVEDIKAGIQALAKADCIRLYRVEGRPYLMFPNWSRYQHIRTIRNKYPGPDKADEPVETCEEMQETDAEETYPDEAYRDDPGTEEDEESFLQAEEALTGSGDIGKSASSSEPSPEPSSGTDPGKKKSTAEKKRGSTRSQERFTRFWDVYPRKIGKGAAEKIFNKLRVTDELLEIMVSSVEAMKKTDQWLREGGRFIPNPATWLGQHRWEDEIPKEHNPWNQQRSVPDMASMNPFLAMVQSGELAEADRKRADACEDTGLTATVQGRQNPPCVSDEQDRKGEGACCNPFLAMIKSGELAEADRKRADACKDAGEKVAVQDRQNPPYAS